MPLQNRVDPWGELHAVASRAALRTGNRGILHDANKRLGRKRWTHRAWVCCVLDYPKLARPVWEGRRWSQLFFLDDATALAAGHRPCGFCRRPDFEAFKRAWLEAGAGPTQDAQVSAIDRILHAERTGARVGVPRADALPAGAMFAVGRRAFLRTDSGALEWSFDGYRVADAAPCTQPATVLTPASVVRMLARGYRPPLVHPSASHGR